jgi:hypothetical protein
MMTKDRVISLLRQACADTGSVRRWAQQHKFSGTFVYWILAGKRPPTRRVLDVLGLERKITYQRKGEK